MQRLSDQVAIVTGASSGIGQATTLAFINEGARVLAVARRADLLRELEEEAKALGGQVLACPTDVTDAAGATAVAKRALDSFGRIDLLVNDAGTNVRERNFRNISLEDWRHIVDVNLTGAFIFTQAVLPTMRAQGRGTIINIVSGAGLRASELTGPAYAASKFGLRALTQSINVEERRHGIRACAIYPGEVNTPILNLRPQPLTPEELSQMLQPEDLAAAAVFVASLPHRATVEDLTIRPTVQRPIR